MAKTLWIAGMLVGAGTAVATVMPHQDAQMAGSRECIEIATADRATCVSGSTSVVSPLTMNLNALPVSADMPTAPTPDAI